MEKNKKILSVLIATILVVTISFVTNNFKAEGTLGDISVYGVVMNNNSQIENVELNGSIASKVITSWDSFVNSTDENVSLVTTVLGTINTAFNGDVYASFTTHEDPETLISSSTENDTIISNQLDYLNEEIATVADNIEKLEIEEGDEKNLGDIKVTYTNEDKSILVYDLESSPIEETEVRTLVNSYAKTVETDKLSTEVAVQVGEITSEETTSEETTSEDVTEEIEEEMQTISKIHNTNIEGLNANENLIIRTDADVVSLTNITSNLPYNTTLYAPNATEIIIAGEKDVDDQIDLTILAPNAAISLSDTTLNGNVYGSNFNAIDGAINTSEQSIMSYDFNREQELVQVTINLIDQYDEVIQTNTYTREAGHTFTTELKIPGKYSVVDVDKAQMVTEGFTLTEDTVIDIQVEQIYDSEITVNYLNEAGEKLQDSTYVYGIAGESYEITTPIITSYTLSDVEGDLIGVHTYEDVVINLTYVETDKEYSLTVSHVDSDGNKLVADTTHITTINSEYNARDFAIQNPRYEYIGVSSTSSAETGHITEGTKLTIVYGVISTCSNLNETVSSTAGTNVITKSVNTATNDEVLASYDNGELIQVQSNITDSTLGKGYNYDGLNYIDYRYSFNTANNYTQIMPMRNTSTSDTYVLITDGGNSYDISSRTNSDGLFTYKNGKIAYQDKLQAAGISSILIKFGECDVTVTEMNKTTTKTTTFDYSVFPSLDQTKGGYAFKYDQAANTLAIDTLAIDSNNKFTYLGQDITINLNDLGIKPKDYSSIYTSEAGDITSYNPKTVSTRYMYEVISLQNPFVDVTSSKKINSTAITSSNEIYGVYYLNGVIKKSTQLTGDTAVVSQSLPYNPDNLGTIVSGKNNLSTSERIYGYVAGNTYTVNDTFKLSAETRVIYAKQKHPKYTTSTEDYTATAVSNSITSTGQLTLDPVYNVNLNGEYTAVDPLYETRYIRIINETTVDFATNGTYDVIAMVGAVDHVTGEKINTKLSIQLSIQGATLDCGDAPEDYGSACQDATGTKRYNIGLNLNANRVSHADAEADALHTPDARGDDTTGITDETGWFNMSTDGVGKINLVKSSLDISFPYTADGNTSVALWIDWNQNGKFEDFEGQVEQVSSSAYNEYGMVTFNVGLHPSFSTISSGDTTFARVRILSNKNFVKKGLAANDYLNLYGETEDFMIEFYEGGNNDYQICNQALSNTPIVSVENAPKAATGLGPNGDESGLIYTADIGEWDPQAGIKNKLYKGATIEVSSKQGIKSAYSMDSKGNNGGASVKLPMFFTTESYSEETNAIHIVTKDKDGNEINLPFTFSIWGLNEYTGDNITESVQINKDELYLDGFEKSMVGITSDSIGEIEEYDNYIKLYTKSDASSEPSSMFLIDGGGLAKSNITIYENAREFTIGLGLDLGQLDMLIGECIEPYGPLSQIEVLGEFYGWEEVSYEYDGDGDGVNDSVANRIDSVPVNIYNSYPFKYQSTNIPIPYFQDFNYVTQTVNIPDEIEFVDIDGDGEITSADTDVTIYRRDFLGTRTEDDWEVVDSKLYTQNLDMVTNTSTVTFTNPVDNNIYGYEYRMEYNFQVKEDVATGVQVVITSDVEFNKGTQGGNTEIYHLNDIVLNILESFSLDIDTIMSDEVLHVQTDSNSISYSYKYLNCDADVCENELGTVDSETGKTERPKLNGDIVIPIPDKEDMNFYSDDNFDMYEDILFSIYDNDMKVFEVPIRRWYPTEEDFVIEDNTELKEFTDLLNPVGQTTQVRANYTMFDGFEMPVATSYTQEVLGVQQEGTTNEAENALLTLEGINAYISTDPSDSVPSSWKAFADGTFVEVDDLTPIFDSELVYVPSEDEICSASGGEECIPQGYHLLNISAEALDETLETSKSTINNKTYKDIYFKDSYSLSEEGVIKLSSVLDDRYIIEDYNGRIYNTLISSECKLESAADEDYTGKYCYNETNSNYHFASSVLENVIAGSNDSTDTDLVIADTVSNGFPLSTEVEVGDKFQYYVYLAEFGLNKSNITISDKVEVTSLPIGYYGDESSFYFKRTNPSDDEVECIKSDTCGAEYEVITSGQIDSTFEIKNQIESNLDLLESFKLQNNWLDTYRVNI